MDELDKFWKDTLGGPCVITDTELTEAIHSGKGVELLVDGDIVAYRAAAACEGRLYTHPLVKDIQWKYKKDADKYCEENSLITTDLNKVLTPEPLSHAIKNVETTLSSIIQHFEGVDIDMRIYLTGKENFRSEISPTYKAHRVDERPYHLDACKEHLIAQYGAEAQDGLEADDLLGIRAWFLFQKVADYCICTTDKDLLGIPGCHFNWITGQEIIMSETEADLFFYTQLLTGDKTDNIMGIKGCGPVGAKKILKEFHDDPALINTKSLYNTVLKAYIAYEESSPAHKDSSPREVWEAAKKNLIENAQQLWILREPFVMWSQPVAK